MRIDEQASYYESIFAEHMAAFVRYKRAQRLSYTAVPGRCGRSPDLSPRRAKPRLRSVRSTSTNGAADGPMNVPATSATESHTRTNSSTTWPHRTSRWLSRDPEASRRPGLVHPYVFTRRELDRLFAACAGLKAKSSSVMPVLLPVLIRLLYGCGLRVSEALNLTRGDVDLNNCCLTVRHAKYDQDRLVPLSSSLADIMRRYDATAPRLFTADRDTRFFTHNDGRPVTSDSIYRWFRKTLWAAGISHGGRGHGPACTTFGTPSPFTRSKAWSTKAPMATGPYRPWRPTSATHRSRGPANTSA
ncbi:putative integrase/recombinase y4rE [Arthrobacter sp. Hiyo8]|nr:putative integrase/recombinase y4rE [Arthrobacter sp. Hiyo8]